MKQSSKLVFLCGVLVFLACATSAGRAAAAWHTGTVVSGLPVGIVGRPSVASWEPERLDVFWRGGDNQLWTAFYNGASWSGAIALGGQITSSPACVSYKRNRIDCFARGSLSDLIQKIYDPTIYGGNGWSNWFLLNVPITNSPAVVAPHPVFPTQGTPQLVVVYRGSTGAVMQIGYPGAGGTGGWSAPQSLGGVIVGSPACASWASGRIDCFVRGLNNDLWQLFKSGTGGWNWASFTDSLGSDPAVTSDTAGRLSVIFKSASGSAAKVRSYSHPSWSATATEPVVTLDADGAGCVSWGAGRIDCFHRGASNSLATSFFRNAIREENALPGSPSWVLNDATGGTPATGREIEGYASDASVNVGGSLDFFVNVRQPMAPMNVTFTIEFYRMGYYGSVGARLVQGPQTVASVKQTETTYNDSYGTFDCADWTKSYTLTVPPSWVSGVYLAKLRTSVDKKQAFIPFVVRDDARKSDFLVQTSVTTYQAYNNWPGHVPELVKRVYSYPAGSQYLPQGVVNHAPPGISLPGKSTYPFSSYPFHPPGHPQQTCFGARCGDAASKVSFNRPYAITVKTARLNPVPEEPSFNPKAAPGVGAGEFLAAEQNEDFTLMTGWEYNMVRFLEREGFDVTYTTNIDTHARGDLISIANHRGFLSVGHDEYYSLEMKNRLTSARNGGVSLGFFSSNNIFHQVAFESDSKGRANRIMVKYFTSPDLRGNPLPGVPCQSPGIGCDRWSPQGGDEHKLMGVRSWDDNPYRDTAGRPDTFAPTGPAPTRSTDIWLTDEAVDGWICVQSECSHFIPLPNLVGCEADSVVLTPSGQYPSEVWPLGPPLAVLAESDPLPDVFIEDLPQALGRQLRHNMTFYQMPSGGAVVFATGTMQWSWGLDNYNPLNVPPNTEAARNSIATSYTAMQMTRNVLNKMLYH